MSKCQKTNPITSIKKPKQKKARIHAALREQVWLRDIGPAFAGKCRISWCQNEMTVFNFQCGHRLAESNGGPTTLENLTAICGRCNISMATMHIEAWEQLGGVPNASKAHWWSRLFHCWK
jgi:hypothetical protein